MPQSVGYGEVEILCVGIRPVEAFTKRLALAPELRSSLRPSEGPVLGQRRPFRLRWRQVRCTADCWRLIARHEVVSVGPGADIPRDGRPLL